MRTRTNLLIVLASQVILLGITVLDLDRAVKDHKIFWIALSAALIFTWGFLIAGTVRRLARLRGAR